MKKKIKVLVNSFILVALILFNGLFYVEATQNRTNNFNKNYSLTGNATEDILNVARAQLGKTGSQLGYTEEWCADFISDCAALANQSAAIPASGSCISLRANIITAGGRYVNVNDAQPGDIVFYGNNGGSHVEIVYAASNGNVSTYGGNSGSGGSLYARSVRQHPTQTMQIAYVVRPNYSGSGCNCSTSYAGKYIVNTSQYPLTMRNGHGTGYSVITSIPKGTEVNVTKGNGSWAHVEWNGYSGYCSMEYLKKSFNNPEGTIDSISGGIGCIDVGGWAFDLDDISTSISIHVYIGGPAGSGAPGYEIVADKYRPDVNNVYSVGDNHGYSDKIYTDCTGLQTVFVYAINIGGGENVCLGSRQVNIEEKNPPSGYNIKISSTNIYDSDSVTITVEPYDDDITNYKLHFVAPNGNTSTVDLGNKNSEEIYCSGLYGTMQVYAEITNDKGTYCGSIGNGSLSYNINEVKWGKCVDLGNDFYAQIGNATSENVITHEGIGDYTNLYMGKNIKSNNQIFHFIKQSNGSYVIESRENNKYCFDIYKNSFHKGTNVGIFPENESKSKNWFIYESGDGYYYFRASEYNSAVLDVVGGFPDEGVNVQIWVLNNSDAQKFSINKMDKVTLNLNKSDVVLDLANNPTTTIIATADGYLPESFYFSNLSNSDVFTTNREERNGNSSTYTITANKTGNYTIDFRLINGITDNIIATDTLNITVKCTHKYVVNIIKPTITEMGYSLHTCAVCGNSYKDNYVDKLKNVGWKQVGNNWYYYNSDGEMQTGWQKISGKQYYFNVSGVMQTSKWISGTYYVKSDGTMAVSQFVDNSRYYVDTNGKWLKVTGWHKINNKFYYFDAKSIVQKSKWIKTNNKWYYVDDIGVMQTSKWLSINNKSYYIDKDGVMQTSKWISGTYYVKSDGTMAVSEIVEGKYYVGTDGKWQKLKGWQKINNKWYYFDSKSVIQKSKWLKLNNKWYYVDKSGVMQTSKWISGTYYVKADGTMAVSEWVDNGKYYVNAAGKWVKAAKK